MNPLGSLCTYKCWRATPAERSRALRVRPMNLHFHKPLKLITIRGIVQEVVRKELLFPAFLPLTAMPKHWSFPLRALPQNNLCIWPSHLFLMVLIGVYFRISSAPLQLALPKSTLEFRTFHVSFSPLKNIFIIPPSHSLRGSSLVSLNFSWDA